jgi:hypothetical protein
MNTYAYVFNTPTMLGDPSGLEAVFGSYIKLPSRTQRVENNAKEPIDGTTPSTVVAKWATQNARPQCKRRDLKDRFGQKSIVTL